MEWSLAIALSFIGVCIILAIWLSAVISKWIDIKKYQETWGRHSTHVQRMENEMLTFYYGFSPYDVPDRKDIFIKNMQKIWAGNQDKFRDNIENKEKELMDTAQHLKSFVKF